MSPQRKPRSPETCRKLALANTGKVFSAERRANIGKARIIHLPQETIIKLEEYWKKRYIPAKWILKTLNLSMRVYLRYLKTHCKHEQIQFLPQNLEPETYECIIQKCKDGVPCVLIAEELGLKHKQVRLIIQKLSAMYDISPLSKPMGNHCEEHRVFLAVQLAEYNKQNPKKKEQNPNWKGGIAEVSDLIRVTVPYKEWRFNVLKRDEYKCVFCGVNRKLHVDHIYPFCLLLRDGKITTPEQAIMYNPLWDCSNGRTLCEACHKQTETYGKQRKDYERTI